MDYSKLRSKFLPGMGNLKEKKKKKDLEKVCGGNISILPIIINDWVQRNPLIISWQW